MLAATAGSGMAADAPATGATADSVLSLARAQRASDSEFLSPDQAFRVSAEAAGADSVHIGWQVAKGYYLYRSRIKVATTSPAVQLGELQLPEGQTKKDEYFGVQQVYHSDFSGVLPVARSAATAQSVPVQVTYQGCAEAGLCYPPQTKTLDVVLPAGGGAASTAGGAAGAADSHAGSAPAKPATGFVSEQDYYAAVIRDSNIIWVIGFFLVVGIGLAFTPCVLPMVPIVSGIILGDGSKGVTTGRAFSLSLIYVLGMALTYTAAGMAVAAGGHQVQAAFQQPWIIVLFAALFIVLALSMFGLFTLQMPAVVQTRLASLSNRQSAGTYGGVAVMGALSALIVTTCVAPALVGALLFIGQSGNMLRGGVALFAMGLGMGAPLLVVGASAGKLLPRAGAWMDMVKRLFGALMLAVAAWMLGRILPDRAMLLLWCAPVLAAAVVLWSGARTVRRAPLVMRLAGGLVAVYGLVLVAGAALGGTDPLAPIPQLSAPARDLPFQTIKSVADLQRVIAQAKAAGRPVMLDFYADWCVSCKEMAKYTFTDPAVQSTLGKAVLLRADVTRNDAEDQALLKYFGIFGPPTIAFYGSDGRERRDFRVVGYMKAPDFASRVKLAIMPTSTEASRAGMT
jgi:thiol:disulfide interchange protein DsbD